VAATLSGVFTSGARARKAQIQRAPVTKCRHRDQSRAADTENHSRANTEHGSTCSHIAGRRPDKYLRNDGVASLRTSMDCMHSASRLVADPRRPISRLPARCRKGCGERAKPRLPPVTR
jgi:hypothetical protein